MRTQMLVIGVLGSIVGSGVAKADTRRALESVQDAIDVVDDQGGKCRRAMFDELVAVEGLLKDNAEFRAAKKLRSIRVHERCPEKVDRLLRNAQDSLEDERDARDDRRDRRRDRRRDERDDRDDRDRAEKPAAPKRPAGVPFADWNSDCRDFWLIMEIARGNTAQGTLNEMSAMFAPACENAAGMGAANYQNGTMAKSSTGSWYYPNGTMAKSSTGSYYYPNGTMAKSSSNSWYYPNGTMAKSGSNTWYYANGSSAGGWEGLASQSCAKSEGACAAYKLALNSDLEDWRTFGLVKLVSTAR